MNCVLLRLIFALGRLSHEICLTRDSFLLFLASTCKSGETKLVNLGTSENRARCSTSLLNFRNATKPQLSDQPNLRSSVLFLFSAERESLRTIENQSFPSKPVFRGAKGQRESHTRGRHSPFSSSFQIFRLTVRAFLTTKNYGLCYNLADKDHQVTD